MSIGLHTLIEYSEFNLFGFCFFENKKILWANKIVDGLENKNSIIASRLVQIERSRVGR